MAKITYANIFSEARTNVLNLISDSSNVADPLMVSGQFRKWIYSRDPDSKATDFRGYPIIILRPARFDPEEMGSLDGKRRFVAWEIDIEIVTSDRGYGSSDGQGLSHMDAISNDVVETFLDLTNRQTLKGFGMSFSDPTVSDVGTEEYQDELIYRRVITLSFRDRLIISA